MTDHMYTSGACYSYDPCVVSLQLYEALDYTYFSSLSFMNNFQYLLGVDLRCNVFSVLEVRGGGGYRGEDVGGRSGFSSVYMLCNTTETEYMYKELPLGLRKDIAICVILRPWRYCIALLINSQLSQLPSCFVISY